VEFGLADEDLKDSLERGLKEYVTYWKKTDSASSGREV